MRAKKNKIENPLNVWLDSDSEDESSDDEEDDAWEMPGRKRKRKPNTGMEFSHACILSGRCR